MEVRRERFSRLKIGGTTSDVVVKCQQIIQNFQISLTYNLGDNIKIIVVYINFMYFHKNYLVIVIFNRIKSNKLHLKIEQCLLTIF